MFSDLPHESQAEESALSVQLLEMVDNSSSLCKSPLGRFFRQ
jgi:hypothetical protein